MEAIAFSAIVVEFEAERSNMTENTKSSLTTTLLEIDPPSVFFDLHLA